MAQRVWGYLFLFLSFLTILLSLAFSPGNAVYLFVGLFLVLYWQRKRFREPVAPPLLKFLLLAMAWSAVLEISLGGRGLGIFVFYLLYFLVCYKVFTRKSFEPLTIFYLSGLFGVFIQAVLTRRLIDTVALAPDLPTGVFFLLLKAAATLTVFGALTSLPFVLLKDGPS